MSLLRQPSLVIPSLIFPLFFAALGTSSFSRATTEVPGFPEVDSFLDFALAGSVVQGILFGSTVGATALAVDIENGFFDRLLSSPSTRSGIIVGRLAGGMVYGAFQTVLFIAILLPFGLSIKGGVAGVLTMALGGTILALAVGALMSAMALKTGSSEAVQGAFPLLFIALFFSSAFFPRETMSGVYKVFADLNPDLLSGRGIPRPHHRRVHRLGSRQRGRHPVDPRGVGRRARPVGAQGSAGGAMTTLDDTTTGAGRSVANTHTFPASVGLMQRSIVNITRLPSAFLPSVLMPIFQAIAFSGTFFAITQIPGFPTDRSINWFLPLGVVMGAGFAGIGIGFTTIRDLEGGFYDRLRLTPAPRMSLITGPLLAALARAAMVTTIVFIVGTLFGARLTHGPLGLIPLYVAALGIASIGTGWGLGLAYIFRDMRAAAIMQLTFFLVIFLTEAQTPLFVMQGWLEDVARINPFNSVIRLSRLGFVDPSITWANTWPGLLTIVVFTTLMMLFARRGLGRLERRLISAPTAASRAPSSLA